MERHIVRLLQNEGLLGKVLLMKPYLALQQVIEAAGGICAADDGETQPDVIVFCMGLSEKTAQILKKRRNSSDVRFCWQREMQDGYRLRLRHYRAANVFMHCMKCAAVPALPKKYG